MKLIRNRIFLAVLCAVISIACIMTLITNSSSDDIVVYTVSSNIEQGTKITEDMLSTKTVTDKGMDNVITNESDLIGKYAVVDLLSGQFFYQSSITEIYDEVLSGLEKLDGEYIAYTISMSGTATSVSSTVKSGDIVSLYVYSNGLSLLPEELKYVEILYATTSDGTENSETAESSISTITFLVTEEQALLLNEYEYSANIHLALVYSGDDEEIKSEYLGN
ncbi:MAG: SAF domain-containing protein [Clostridia bacterium]